MHKLRCDDDLIDIELEEEQEEGFAKVQEKKPCNLICVPVGWKPGERTGITREVGHFGR